MFLAVLTMLGNLLSDLLYGAVDPRIRLKVERRRDNVKKNNKMQIRKLQKQAAENKSMESPLETCDEAPVQKQAGDRRTDLFRSHDRSLYCGTNRISVFRYYSN